MVKREFDPLFTKLARLHAEHPETHPPAPKRFNWHALRHFAVSCWIDADLPPKTVQTFAGHSTLAVTMDIYGHLFKKSAHNDVMDAIAKENSLTRDPSGRPRGGRERSVVVRQGQSAEIRGGGRGSYDPVGSDRHCAIALLNSLGI